MRRNPRSVARRLGAALVFLLALGPGVIAVAPAAEAYVPSAAVKASYQARVIHQINVARARYGRGGLTSNSCPRWYATRWSYYLATSGQFKHQSMYPLLRTCRASVAAENLARGYTSPDRLVAAWMASPGHRANILDRRLKRIGVAAYYVRGQWTVAADFTRS